MLLKPSCIWDVLSARGTERLESYAIVVVMREYETCASVRYSVVFLTTLRVWCALGIFLFNTTIRTQRSVEFAYNGRNVCDCGGGAEVYAI